MDYKMACDLPYSSTQQLKYAAETLLNDALFSTSELLCTLKQTAFDLSWPRPIKTIPYELRQIAKALIAKEVVKHPDMYVNISVSCCISHIVRIYPVKPPYNDRQLKEFFELVVTTFEKLSSASGGCFTEMSEVLEIFRALGLPVLMLEMHLDASVVRLFKQFLTVSESNSTAIVRDMEKIMTMIIEEGDEIIEEDDEIIEEGNELIPELARLLVTSVKTENQIASSACYQLAEKVLKNCDARLKPYLADMAQSVENGENLSGSKMKVWCPKDEMCYEGVVKSFNRIKKGKVLYDDGDEEFLDLESEQWPLVENASAMQNSVKQSSLLCVHGYNVKQSVAHILEAIFKKHGDISSECLFKTASTREYFLDVVCEVIRQIQSNDVIDMQEIESKLSDAEAAKLHVSWIRTYLEAIHKRKEGIKKSCLLMETKGTAILVKRAAEMDLKERRVEFEKAERCVKVLQLVEKKLNNNILESKAEKDSWVEQPIL